MRGFRPAPRLVLSFPALTFLSFVVPAYANSPPKPAAPTPAAKPSVAPHAPSGAMIGHPNQMAGMHGGFSRNGAYGHANGFDHGRGGFDHGHYAFHGRDVHGFSRYDRERWAGGRWNQTCFAGRCGWWWPAGGLWYYYDQPVYPYPLVVAETTYADPVEIAAPPPAEAPPPPQLRAPPSFRYYCDNPPGYFPAVAQCNGAYRSVAPP